eukprot:5036366-Pyramimonas_sp.AAC.1
MPFIPRPLKTETTFVPVAYTKTESHPNALTFRPVHSQTHSHPDSFILRGARTQRLNETQSRPDSPTL